MIFKINQHFLCLWFLKKSYKMKTILIMKLTKKKKKKHKQQQRPKRELLRRVECVSATRGTMLTSGPSVRANHRPSSVIYTYYIPSSLGRDMRSPHGHCIIIIIIIIIILPMYYYYYSKTRKRSPARIVYPWWPGVWYMRIYNIRLYYIVIVS